MLREREARIDELTGRLLVTTEAATIWQERARVLGEQLALGAPRPQNGIVGAPTATERQVLPTEPSAPWWRRWLLAVYG